MNTATGNHSCLLYRLRTVRICLQFYLFSSHRSVLSEILCTWRPSDWHGYVCTVLFTLPALLFVFPPPFCQVHFGHPVGDCWLWNTSSFSGPFQGISSQHNFNSLHQVRLWVLLVPAPLPTGTRSTLCPEVRSNITRPARRRFLVGCQVNGNCFVFWVYHADFHCNKQTARTNLRVEKTASHVHISQ